MRIFIRACGLLAAVFFVSACSSHTAGTAVPPTTDQAAASSFMGSDLGPNVRRVCNGPRDNGMMQCDALVRTDVGGIGPDVSGFGPADLQAAYNLPSSTNGNGQIVAIVDAFGYPTAEDDLATYRSNFGLPACTTANGCFKKVNQKGQQKNYPVTNSGWDAEQALDVDMVSATCPNCHIILVQANNNSAHNLGIAVNEAVTLGANVVSNSYSGGCNASKTTRCHGNDYNHPGVIILASSGDGGYGIGVPAAFPSVISVGGTHLVHTGSGRGWTETVWRGTGSGCTNFPKPTWQTDTGCVNRTSNDVAAVADPATGVAVYINGRWAVYGGTSVSSPLLGGVYGLAANEGSLNAGQSLYQNTADLYDITSGTNGSCSPTYLCTGGTGYDGPTGNGTPNGIGAF